MKENPSELIELVKERQLEAGISFDGDGDRIGVITDAGNILWGDELLMPFSRSILKDNPGSVIIGDVKCSQKLYDDISKHGGRPIMWKAGHSLMKGKMKEEKAILAGELSGHFFLPTNISVLMTQPMRQFVVGYNLLPDVILKE